MMMDQKKIPVDKLDKRKLVVAPLGSLSGKSPIVVKKNSKIRNLILKGENSKELLKNIKLVQPNAIFKEDVIYESCPGDFLQGVPHKVTLINRLNNFTNTSRTVAKFTNLTDGTDAYELTSDRVSQLIGQKNYDIVFSALCSVISQESRIRGIMALLLNNQSDDQTCQRKTEMDAKIKTSKMIERDCQTDENCMDLIFKMKQKKRTRRSVLTPYVVKDVPKKNIKKVVIRLAHVPSNPSKILEHKTLENEIVEAPVKVDPLPDLQLSDDSNSGSIDNLSSFSGYSNPQLLHPKPLLEMIGQCTTNETNVSAPLNVMQEDPLHIVTPETLKTMPKQERDKLLWTQLYYDWKTCLQTDEDGYLPIHKAVLHGDLDLLRRHCLVLRNKQESLDIPAGNMTALQMSIFQDSEHFTAMLLQYGADPLLTDDDHRTSLHLAADVCSDHLTHLVHYCKNNAREILQDHDDILKPPVYEHKSDAELATILMDHVCQMVDGDGHTPLMLASKTGNYNNVRQLIEASPSSINIQNPNSGSTALFLAIHDACLDATNRANKSKVADHFYKTILLLVENDADPRIANLQGMNVHDLLGEINNGELSNLVCLHLVKKNINGEASGSKDLESYMLIKDENGELLNVADTKKDKTKPKRKSKTDKADSNNKNAKPIVDEIKTEAEDHKPIILENIALPQTAKIPIKDVKSMVSPTKTLGPKDMLITVKHTGTASTSVGNDLGMNAYTVDNKETIPAANVIKKKRDASFIEVAVNMEAGGPENKKAKGSLK